jgi:hypothetical protein
LCGLASALPRLIATLPRRALPVHVHGADNGVLEHIPGSPWTDIRYVRVNTTASVSWVSWREIQIFAP